MEALGVDDKGKPCRRRVKAQVYAVPKDGFRGAPTDGFKVVIEGVPITDRNLGDLRKRAEAILSHLCEEDHEKVLVVRTSGRPCRQMDEFGIDWEVGWRVKKLGGAVLCESRLSVLSVENYDEEYEPEEADGIIIGSKPGYRGKQHNKIAVIPWTAEREALLRQAVKAIGKMRDDLNAALLKPEAFAGLLDAKAGLLLTDGGGK
jgi:hypothetical protein